MKLLVLDDEPLVAMLLADYLDALGHEVATTVETVEAGLEAAGRDDIDLAVLDCRLGDGDHSWPVADRLIQAGVPVLFSSGVSRAELPERFAGRPMLAKPYSLGALEQAIADATN